MIETFYEVPNKSIDKSSPWYSIKDKIIYIRNIKAKYCLEVIRRNESSVDYLVLLSDKKVNSNFKRCYTDDYGRLKIKLINHSNYLNNALTKDANIKFDFEDTGSENNISYIVYKISVI